MILLGIFSILNFLFYFFKPENKGNAFLFALLGVALLYSSLKKLYLWYNYSNISIPEQPEKTPDLSVDILTTYFPGEPRQMTITTLEAITKVTYPHTSYLCDEANDPFLKKFCKEHGIVHVTRDNRKDAKAGNINNALKTVATGDICVILDPDHIPEPDFLDPILPHFANPEMGFVQIVQSYYNTKETLVARGAAEQTFQFYGPMMMTLNSYGAVNAIGANCVFRRTALDSIGGHAPGLCEDMHTAMLLYSKGWKAVYLPLILARGLSPSNLTDYFKQQLKWSRGTFDLLLKVYPKIFTKLTWRQKIHFGILPLHYLGGIICLLNFLIPIFSLLFSVTPWKGNIVDFGLVILPVIASSVLIRTYVQKWVIEKKERGFHLVGGLLHINTWWVYTLGFLYTIVDKKIPYLPTPKENDFNTNLRIIIPNAAIAFLSIFAIIYGLSKDFTPFSLFMACFALFNAGIMFFGIYLSIKVTNQNKILRNNLRSKTVSKLGEVRDAFYGIANLAFSLTRITALPLLLLALVLASGFKHNSDLSKWNQVKAYYSGRKNSELSGIFAPGKPSGLSDLNMISQIESKQNVDFDIISFYLGWSADMKEGFSLETLDSIHQKDAIPMITWEPWLTDDINSAEKHKILEYISAGNLDHYIATFANKLKRYDRPIFLRFAHEYDNPNYPWSNSTPEAFKAAWIHVYNIIKEQGAIKVMMVWNPWQVDDMEKYYPGDDYVDWIGVTALNYGPLNSSGNEISFNELYSHFRKKIFSFSRKPVMLAEFGSVKILGNQRQWLKQAMKTINSKYHEIKAIVLFHSAFDANIPPNNWYDEQYIDWTTDSIGMVHNNFSHRAFQDIPEPHELQKSNSSKNPVTEHVIKGVNYKKGLSWRNNYYALTRQVLERDFSLMIKAGFNTIQFTGGNIYDYNLLKYSSEYNLQVTYRFDIDQSLDFVHPGEKLEELKEEIISRVRDLRDNKNIIAYSFPFSQEKYFQKPLLLSERNAYLNWLQEVTTSIKKIDPSRSLVLELKLNAETNSEIASIDKFLPVDSYGITVDDTTGLKRTLNFAENKKLSVYISSVAPEALLGKEDLLKSKAVVLENWQDERWTNKLSLDGLVDFEGRRKRILAKIEDQFGNTKVEIDSTVLRILKPATPLLPGDKYTYHALLFQKKQWIKASRKTEDYTFNWYLVKKDVFGHPLALKELGESTEILVKVPENYHQYELLLTATNKETGYVISSKSKLNTPLIRDTSGFGAK